MVKTMEVSELIAIIESIAPLAASASWDKSGVQVAALRTRVRRIAVCLDPTPERIAEAIAQDADFILSHHPLSLAPRLPAVLDAWNESLRLLFKADIGLYAAHTSLDVNPQGPAGWLARELGLSEVEVLEAVENPQLLAYQPLGYGLCGNLPEALDFGLFLNRLAACFKVAGARICGPPPSWIRRVAYCPGSGASLIALAKNKGADIFITGDVKYHAALEAEIPTLDVGHHALEEEMMRQMSLLLQSRLPKMEIIFLASESPLHAVNLNMQENSDE